MKDVLVAWRAAKFRDTLWRSQPGLMGSVKGCNMQSFRIYLGPLGAACLLSTGALGAEDGIVRGSLTGLEALQPAQHVAAAKSDSKRWSWREPSPAVSVQYLAPFAMPTRDVVVVAESVGAAPPPSAPMLVRVTGGRMIPSTIVVAPGTRIMFKNADPFEHRLRSTDAASLPLADTAGGTTREWTASAAGTFELLDETTPSFRGFVVVTPNAVRTALPKADGKFSLTVPEGDYVIRAYFAGKSAVTSETQNVKAGRAVDMKAPLKVTAQPGGN